MKQVRPFAVFRSLFTYDQSLTYKTPQGALVARIYTGSLKNWNQDPENLVGISIIRPDGTQTVRYYDNGKPDKNRTEKFPQVNKLSPEDTETTFRNYQLRLDEPSIPKIQLAERKFSRPAKATPK